MQRFIRLGGLTVAAVTTLSLVAIPSASAAPVTYFSYFGASGGTRAQLADNTVTSDLTSPSVVQGYLLPTRSDNNIAAAHVGDLVTTGAIATHEQALAIAHGGEVVSHVHIAAATLLGGAIKVRAIDTKTVMKSVNGVLSSDTNTTFVGLKIAGVDLPVTIPKNYSVTIPGLAQIVLNGSYTAQANGVIGTTASAIYISLLDNSGPDPKGLQVFVNPILSIIIAHVRGTPVVLGGEAYGTHVTVDGGDAIGIESGKTADEGLQSGGTGGTTITNSTASVSLPDLLQTGVITSGAHGVTANRTGDAFTSNEITNVNLLDGLIGVDAIKVSAEVRLLSNGTYQLKPNSQLVGLTIAGKHYPVHVKPNTTIDVAGLGTVTINKQYVNGNTVGVQALNITLSTARAGLPVGAVIEVGAASAYILN